MKKVEIFDPAMCCETGVCGPSVDPVLTRVASVIFSLEKKGFDVKRYNLANDPASFAENKIVNQVLHEKGPDALPVVLVDEKVELVGEYPTNATFAAWFGIDEAELQPKKPKLSFDLKQI
ncbi:arsenite efflux transporter metallochaperone ArsD [Bacillus tianshenii]|nr:arsenite efflux transporter metallochaperone ArsD [Bacillus tianshenii]